MNKRLLSSLTLSSALVATLVTSQEVSAKEYGYTQMNLEQNIQSKKEVKNVLKELPGAKNLRKLYKHYEVTNVDKDNLGYTHYTLQPKSNGKFATNKEIKVHTDESGKVVLVNGETDVKDVTPTNEVKITKEVALDNAFNALKLDKKKTSNLKDDVVKKNNVVIDGDKNKLVYDIELVTVIPKVGHWLLKVDAENGQILEKVNLVRHVATTGTGIGILGDSKNININSITGGYALQDLTHKGQIAAYSLNSSTGSASLVTDTDKIFNLSSQRAAVDANYYAAETYDFYKNNFGRESYDNLGSPINSIVHVNTLGGRDNTNNAAWIGDKMVYGDGDGRIFTGLAGGNDIVAHELAHGVTQETANLQYQGQSGALNESFSDVFGYFVDNNDWLMGEDVYTPGVSGDALRSMSNPELYDQPSHMSQYYNTTSDNGGVHINSGIPNKAAYNTITKLGNQKSQQIYYRALTEYLTSTSNFADAKEALAQSAYDLYGQIEADIVWNAWNSVGV